MEVQTPTGIQDTASSGFKLTVFTPTYNRAHTLPNLYASLLRQGPVDCFEWLVIDDNSTDDTEALIRSYIAENKIHINYVRLPANGGKPRAINRACGLARSPYLFIVDSDDYLVDDIIPFAIEELKLIANVPKINGLGFLQMKPDGSSKARPTFQKYIDATNLERKDIGLNYDCNEIYKVEILRKYPFEVWEGEIFTPEQVVLNAMAADGYRIRWFNRPGVVSEYLADGLTKGSWGLQKRNPMGYAMMHNSQLLYQSGFKSRFRSATLFGAQCLLGKHPEYILRSNAKWLSLLAFPASIITYLRRLWQYRSA